MSPIGFKQLIFNQVSLALEMPFFIGFPITISKPQILNWIWFEKPETINKLCTLYLSSKLDTRLSPVTKKYQIYLLRNLVRTHMRSRKYNFPLILLMSVCFLQIKQPVLAKQYLYSMQYYKSCVRKFLVVSSFCKIQG